MTCVYSMCKGGRGTKAALFALVHTAHLKLASFKLHQWSIWPLGRMVFRVKNGEKESLSSSGPFPLPLFFTPYIFWHLRSYGFMCIIRAQYGTISISDMKRTRGMRARALATPDMRRKWCGGGLAVYNRQELLWGSLSPCEMAPVGSGTPGWGSFVFMFPFSPSNSFPYLDLLDNCS